MNAGTGRLATVWLSLVTIVTIVFGCLELTVQQSFRTAADDPQIQMAEDAASSRAGALAAVRSLKIGGARRDMARSLAPWLALFSAQGEPLAASSTLDGAPPRLPPGTFVAAATRGEDRVTWQPRAGVRAAVVVRRTPDGEFVVAGRSLRETELRERALWNAVLVCWALTALACLAAARAL